MKVIAVFISYFIFLLCFYFPKPPPLLERNLCYKNYPYNKENVKSNFETIVNVECAHHNLFHILYLSILVITFLWLFWLDLCREVIYISFNTNLNMRKNKSIKKSPPWFFYVLVFIMLGLLLTSGKESIIIFVSSTNPNQVNKVGMLLKFKKYAKLILIGTIAIFMFSIAVTPVTQYLCVAIFQIMCHTYVKKNPCWLSAILILISNDIECNPGPEYHSNFLNFMSWNLNSLSTNNFERVQLIEAHNTIFNYDLISICETSLNDSLISKVPELNGYTFEPANHVNNMSHGGVGLFYKNSLPAVIRRDLSFDECIVIELKFGRKKVFFTVLYRSPAFKHNSLEFQTFLSDFKLLHSNIQAENPFALFFTGDFNGHSQLWWNDGDTNLEGQEMEELFNSLNLSQIISEPTNFEPGKKPSCIDLILTDQPNLVLASGTRASLDTNCHHQIIYCKVNFRIPPSPPSERKTWHYHRANSAAIQRCFTNFPWVQHFNINPDINWQVKSFTDIFLNIMNNYIPNEVKRFVPRDPPWISKQLKTLLNRKNRFFKNYKKHGYKPDDKIKLETFRKECKEAVERAKTDYLTNLGSKLNDPNTSQKAYWKIINRAMNKCRAPIIPPLLVNNVFILNCKEKAKLFNDFFCNQCKLIINNSTLPVFKFLTDKRIDNLNLQNDEIVSLIRNLNPNKASGSDGISGHMLILCDDSIALPLKIMFKNILETSSYPDIWKRANVTPIFKKNDKQAVKNYRPISLLPIIGKLFEKIIFNNLYTYLTTNNLITKNQSGFRPGDSTSNQLLYLVNEIHEAFENPKSLEVRAVFLDISKAFDKVWHNGLIFKLKQNGISGNLLNLFKSYLQNRRQRVVINGSYSEYLSIESGVPQGSVLGPLLFLVYINDLENSIKSNIKFFADDTMLFSTVEDPVVSASNLNHDLDLIHKWAHQWKMEFNPDPLKQATEVLFSCKRIKHNHPQLTFHGTVVAKMNDQKHLGLTLDSKLSFEKHVNEKIIKAKKNIGVIKHLSKYLPHKTLDQMYKALVRSHLDYCDIIYHEPCKVNQPPLGVTLTAPMEKIEKIQYLAALAITGTWKGSNRTKLYEELGWESLTDRRRCRRILQVHKIVTNRSPLYLKDKLPINHRHLIGANVPNSIHGVLCRTERYKKSFFPDAISSWNTFISHFAKMPSFTSLKSYMSSFFRPNVKSIFGIHDPSGIRYLYQLRVSLSPLRSHKMLHNFDDTPSNLCHCKEGIEDTYHFLFKCPLHVTHRASLATSVIGILYKYNINHLGNLVHIYLYGHGSISHADNKAILLSTIKFIKDTKRFLT